MTTRGGAQPSADADGPKAQIWLMRVDGGEAWKLTDAKEGVGSYEWAPDSRKIAYLARDPLPKEEDEARRRKDDERDLRRGPPDAAPLVDRRRIEAGDAAHHRDRLYRPRHDLGARQFALGVRRRSARR